MWNRAVLMLYALVAPAICVAVMYGLASLLYWIGGRSPDPDVMMFGAVLAYFVMLYALVQKIKQYRGDY